MQALLAALWALSPRKQASSGAGAVTAGAEPGVRRNSPLSHILGSAALGSARLRMSSGGAELPVRDLNASIRVRLSKVHSDLGRFAN